MRCSRALFLLSAFYRAKISICILVDMSALSPGVPISWGVGPRPKTWTRPLGSFAPQTTVYASPSWIVLSFNSGWASTMALISSYKIWISKVYTTDPCFFIWGKLTIVPAASLKGTPFFLVCVLMYTSSLRGGHPSALPYKFYNYVPIKMPQNNLQDE